MKVIDVMDYSTLLWMQSHPSWAQAVDKCSYSGLQHGLECEGVAGYIEVKVELDIKDLSKFASMYEVLYEDRIRDNIMKIRAALLHK
jgi:hypothetical protein